MSMTDSMTREDALQILGLTEPVTPDAVKSAYKNLSKKVHPDVGGNDFLFKMTHQAYELLFKPNSSAKPNQNTRSTSQQSKTQTQKHREPELSWDDIIRQSDFRVDFDTFSRIVLLRETHSIQYRNYNVKIKPIDIEFYNIKTSFPIIVTVRTWPSRWAKLFGKKPDANSATFIVNNLYRSDHDYTASRYFGKNLTATVQTGYHEITLEYLNRKQTIKTCTKDAYDMRKFEKKLVLSGISGAHDIHVNIYINVVTEQKSKKRK